MGMKLANDRAQQALLLEGGIVSVERQQVMQVDRCLRAVEQ